MAQHYYLYHEKIYSCLDEFFNEHSDYTYSYAGSDHNKQLEIVVEKKQELKANKKPESGKLTIYFSNGKTSFNPQGKLSTVCSECRDYIIKEATISEVMTKNKQFVFHNVKTDEFNALKELIEEMPGIRVKSGFGDDRIVDRLVASGPYGCTVTITYYHTSKILVQGTVTTLLLNVVSELRSLLGADKVTADGCFLEVLGASGEKLLSDNLDDHLDNRHLLVGTPYEQLIMSSIDLVNSDVVLGEYSSLTHGVLRALEGIIGMRLHQADSFTEEKPMIGSRFERDQPPRDTDFVLRNHYRTNFANSTTIQILERAYTFYYNQRHGLFHSDIKLPTSTRVISKKEIAISFVEEALRNIKSILRNW